MLTRQYINILLSSWVRVPHFNAGKNRDVNSVWIFFSETASKAIISETANTTAVQSFQSD
jgi:hypothetical protein